MLCIFLPHLAVNFSKASPYPIYIYIQFSPLPFYYKVWNKRFLQKHFYSLYKEENCESLPSRDIAYKIVIVIMYQV